MDNSLKLTYTYSILYYTYKAPYLKKKVAYNL